MNRRPGFSLLELIISVTIMVTIFVTLGGAVANALKENKARQSTVEAIDRANQIIRSTASLIRQAQPSPTGAFPIVSASSTSLTFYTASSGETIQQARLFLSGTTLQLGRIQPVGNPATYPSDQEVVTTVLTNVRNGSVPLFEYYDVNYTGTQAAMNPINLSAIRVVKLGVIYDDNPNVPPSATTIELRAQLRNLKDNY